MIRKSQITRVFASSPRAQWSERLAKETKKDIDGMMWETAEGISVKPLYSEEDVDPKIREAAGQEHPGIYPFTRGPYASMYTNKPWTIR
jgi:methylmalonyl-CoA mutase